jgi:16S rRNA (uracil1498-N3)-methyltransferase
MPADRFYYDGSLTKGTTILLNETEQQHLRVMRIAVGEEVELVNGKGALARGKLTALDKKQVSFHILESHLSPPLSPQISLGIPLMRPNKLDLIVEKGTELGAAAFYFYPADYSEKSELSTNQLQRLRALSISALKQSGRLYLPSFQILARFEELFLGAPVLYGDTRATTGPTKTASALFITGPERGFSPKELALLSQKGTGVSLSPCILRAETAPLAALSLLMRPS